MEEPRSAAAQASDTNAPLGLCMGALAETEPRQHDESGQIHCQSSHGTTRISAEISVYEVRRNRGPDDACESRDGDVGMRCVVRPRVVEHEDNSGPEITERQLSDLFGDRDGE